MRPAARGGLRRAGPDAASAAPDAAAERARLLLEQGEAALTERWDDDASMPRSVEHPEQHDPRDALDLARALLIGRRDAGRAHRAIRAVLALQERRPGHAHYGNSHWAPEFETVTDLNAIEFMLDGLTAILLEPDVALPADLREEVAETIALGLQEVARLDVHLHYTNIALSDVANSVLGGQLVGDAEAVARGARRLVEWLALTGRTGAPHEYNSPTYCAVDIERLAALAGHAADPVVALHARMAEERLWVHVAAHYHPGLAQLAGPHARAYFDGWTGSSGYLKTMLWRLIGDDRLRATSPYAGRGREERLVAIARDAFHCPADVLPVLQGRRYPWHAVETVDLERGVDITTYMTESYALGSASTSFAVGDPREPWRQSSSLLLHVRTAGEPGFGTLSVRYVSDDNERRSAPDRWDEGVYVCAQHHNRAILGYGLMPRLRPARSYRLSFLLACPESELEAWVGDARVDALPAPVAPGDVLAIAAGDVYLAIIPLEPTDLGVEAPIELVRDDGYLRFDIYNYRGPPKQFWEQRSQAGPFFKCNVRNAAIVEVAGRDEYADFAAFRRHIAGARVADVVDGDGEREIAYATDAGTLAMRYSLRDMRLIERAVDGVPYSAPVGRAGALDGQGWQWAQTRATMLDLPSMHAIGGAGAKWAAADPQAGRYVYHHLEDDDASLWIETPALTIECDAFGIGRVEVDERAGVLTIETGERIGGVRVRSPRALRLLLNGADVSDAMTRAADDVLVFGGA